ncbi:MAG: ABC transporter substrate-binding protein [Lachnospiraceae bacterium]|nr:ABC transporter substrate-binding protein [Lachnospiraceae bacterium]
MKKIIRKAATVFMAAALITGLCACQAPDVNAPAEKAESADDGKTYKVGICNYVDDASLNQIVDNIESQLETLGKENGVTFEISYDNGNADPNVLNQIIANFIADDVDLMVGVATPVAMIMQSLTEGKDIPVVFAAVSDPEGAGLVASNDAPGANITGTSDYLDTNAIMNLIFANDPDAKKIGLLYDIGQDASTAPIEAAKAYLDEKGIEYVEHTGTNVDEIVLAAQAMVSDDVDAIFTPTDNTVMTAELSIYETLADAGIPHYTGADSFALNGAFLGYGVDYANLGVETANMIKGILIDGNDPATTPVMTFDNGTATINTDTCTILGFDYEELKEVFGPYCLRVQEIQTAENFES